MVVALSFITMPHAAAQSVAEESVELQEVDIANGGERPVQDLGRDFFASDQLKKIIPQQSYEDGQALSRAFDLFEKESFDACLAELKSLSADTVFHDYRIYLAASCFKGKGEFQGALDLIGNPATPKTKITWEIYWLKLDVLAEMQRMDLVRQAVTILLKSYASDRLKQARAAYVLGKAYLRAGQKTSALNEFQKAILIHVGTVYDKKIFAEIAGSGLEVEDVFTEAQWNLRALKLIENGSAHRATKLYQMLMRRHGSRGSYEERLAYSVFRERRYALAAGMIEKILHNASAKTDRLTLLVRLSQSYARSDNFDNAIRVNRQIISEYPNTSSAADAKKKLGFLYFDSKQFDKAIDYYKYGRTSQDRFYRFWSHYLSKDYDAALKEIQGWYSGTKGKGDAAKLNYWMGRLQEKLGRRGLAHNAYQKARMLAGDTYYGLLAQQRLSSGLLFPRTMINPSFLSHVPRVGKGDGLESDVVLENPNLIRGAMLYAMGQDLFAYNESQTFLSGRNGLGKDDIAALNLSGNFNAGYGIYKSAMANRVPGCDDEKCAWTMAYPRAYEKYVQEFTRHWGIPEGLAYSVMRQESVFRPEAFSYAYANGLMQIIPPTGEEIADKIAYKGFHPGQLTDPRINTLFGTYYLSHLLKEFGNNLVYAIAGYNAGPDAVDRWIKRYGHLEMDEFVELIAYEQTRDYVRKVLFNYLIYDRMYFR